jgi:uncharacterized protein YndB with AHSA1/START domain
MNTVTTTQVYKNSLEEVWKALSDEQALQKWYFPVRNYQFEVGKEFKFHESEDSDKFLHKCRFTEIVPMKRIAYSWEYPDHSKGRSLVTWTLEPQGEFTKVMLTHAGLETFADSGDDFKPENFQFGWDHFVHDVLRLYLNGIEKLVFKTTIGANAEKVWNVLWDKEQYPLWTEPFTAGSYYSGEIAPGNRIHFLTPEGHGMYSDVAWVKENEHVVFLHIGEMKNFKELPGDEKSEMWTRSSESYQLLPAKEGVLLRVEVDCDPQYLDSMKEMFPKALQKIKELCER